MRVGNVKPFVLYALRHTFLTRLGEAGCDAWTLARIAGHSSITMSSRYVHPSGHAVFSAMDRLQAQLPEAIVERKALPN
jgi:integrase